MRGFLVLLIAGIVGTSLAQSNLDAEGWRRQFESYDHHSPEWQRRIILSIDDFSQSYIPLVENLPAYRDWERAAKGITNRIDDLLRENERSEARQLEALKAELGEINRDVHRLDREVRGKYLKVVKELLTRMSQILQKGLASGDKAVREASLSVLLREINRYEAARPAFELCGQGRTDYGSLWRSTITDLFLKEAKIRPAPLLDYVRSRGENYVGLAVILSDAKISSVQDTVIGLLSSSDRDVFSSGCECVTAWPQPQYLPYLTARLKTIESSPMLSEQISFENTLGYAIRSYGPRGPEAILRIWGELSDAAKQVAIKQCFELPCKATLKLYYRALEDGSQEAKEEAAGNLLDLFDREWDGYYSGRNPRDLTPGDKAEAQKRLMALSRIRS